MPEKNKKENLIILSDGLFKDLFGREENKALLSCLLSEIIKEDYKYIYENIKYINKDLGKGNIKNSKSILDVLVEIEDVIVNVEGYISYTELNKNKNINYISKLWLRYYNSKNRYKNNKSIIQINIIKKGEEENYYIKGKIKKYIKNIKIIDIVIDKGKEEEYTKGKQGSNIELWKKFLINKPNKNKLKEIIEKMKYDEEIKGEMKGDVEKYMTMEDLREIGTTLGEWIDIWKYEAREEGIKIGKRKGRAEERKSTISQFIRKMLKMNMKYSDISEITGVSEEEIKEITHEMDLNNIKNEKNYNC